MNRLKSENISIIDRQGAAQGLSEVIAGLGINRLKEIILNDLYMNITNSNINIREGYISLLIYLPTSFGIKLQPYLPEMIPCILKGLADEIEGVRESSLKAGQMIIKNYAITSIDLLLPELEKGLFDDSWRIRFSSLQLVGDLFIKILGISNNNNIMMNDDEEDELEDNDDINNDDIDEEEEEGIIINENNHNKHQLINILGKDRYQSILASIYILRNDITGSIRLNSLKIWKSVVNNTPKVMKEILPKTMEILINFLASTSFDKRQLAAKSLGDLVRKLGENILEEIIIIFENGLKNKDSNTRQGVCIGMGEVMMNGGKSLIGEFIPKIIPLIKNTLIDPDSEVREAAAKAFEAEAA
jgi:hypothetical protein